MKRTVIGVDPGLAVTGYGVVATDARNEMRMVEGGVIRTKASDSLEQRLNLIHRDLEQVIAEFKPGEMAIEDLHSRYRNLKTAIIMGHARGIAVLAAGQSGLSVHSYQPRRIKSVVTGSGAADKTQMLKAVSMLLRLQDELRQPDVGDALGAAICHVQIVRSQPPH